MNKNNYIQSGQALLFVVVVMTVALAVGIGVSVQTISSLQRTSQTDTSVRVEAAAEAGIERFLVVSNNTKALIASDPATNCSLVSGATYTPTIAGGGCLISLVANSISTNSTNNITSQVVVKVTAFNSNLTPFTDSGHYGFDVPAGQTKEINLQGYNDDEMDLCWKGKADFLYVVYDSNGIQTQGGVSAGSLAYTKSGFISAAGGQWGYDYCSRLQLGDSDNYGLRLQAIGSDVTAGVLGVGADLPTQGYKIVANGIIKENTQTVSTKTITVYQSLPYLPGIFDYGVYATGIGL